MALINFTLPENLATAFRVRAFKKYKKDLRSYRMALVGAVNLWLDTNGRYTYPDLIPNPKKEFILYLPDQIESKFRNQAFGKYGYKNESLQKGIESAISYWISHTKIKVSRPVKYYS